MKGRMVFLLIFGLLSGCQSETWVLEKDRLPEVPEVKTYVDELQGKTGEREKKIFTISEGKHLVVISSGNHTKLPLFEKVDVSSGNTVMHVREVPGDSKDSNPYVVVGLDDITGELRIVTDEGETWGDE